MVDRDRCAPGKIGNGAGHLEEPALDACRQTKPLGDLLQQFLPDSVSATKQLELPWAHTCIAVYPQLGEALPLDMPRPFHPEAHHFARLGRPRVREDAVPDARDLDLKVDTVKQRTGETSPVALNHGRRTGATVLGIPLVTTWTGVHGRH